MTLIQAAFLGFGSGLGIGAVAAFLFLKSHSRRVTEAAEDRWREKWERSREDFLGAAAELRATRALLSEQRGLNQEALETTRAGHAQALGELRRSFETLSRQIVSEAQPELARATHDRLEEFRQLNEIDAEARRQALEKMLIPLDERLRAYQERLTQSLHAQSNSVAQVREGLESLSQASHLLAAETRGFRDALRSHQARGQWGENTLRRVIESAGLQSHCDFSEQPSIGAVKPDVIIHLPEDRRIIIDAKAPDFSALASLDGADHETTQGILKDYGARLKERIRELAKKEYPRHVHGAFEWTLLFLPADALLHAGVQADPDLLSWAHSRRILLTTPHSLMATLTMVSWSWRRLEQAESAREVIELAETLRSRIQVFLDHFNNLRLGLEKANEAYNRAVGSYERSVEPSIRKLEAFRSSDDAPSSFQGPHTTAFESRRLRSDEPSTAGGQEAREPER